MEQFKSRKQPEAKIQKEIVTYFRNKEWFVVRMVGNAFQQGIPDLLATHHKYGPRFIEVKLPGMKGSHFTAAQLEYFPKFCANGMGIWIMTAANAEQYRMVVTEPPNWWQYLSTARKV